ncbi:sugar phosphate isomerase/epimerase [Alicyclobacillus sp. SO9]|uniref:sugar phosphate isomerase/epimerase family protein n=1 Tax=Alicyclobacillus sp. SO9 TaxID=2665646 RepID=UPI0018E8C85C|nr:sugar phosphate isomerase/epimerase family protein [Alicyclobacillus sp. SO9]QQE80497.1 sugar phosphate isomerase/epimerase [Alicyclobacillus sp. SO9]
MDLQRLGISAITTNRWTLEEDVLRYARHGIPHIGIWSHKCEDSLYGDVYKLVTQHGMRVSNLCFSGMFTGTSKTERQEAVANAKRFVDYTKELQAGCLLIVSGPIQSHSLRQALAYVKDGLCQVTEYAEKQGVDLGLEALHPLELTSFSVLNKLSAAIELVHDINSERLGFFLDTYNNGWDPDFLEEINYCKGKIKGVHLADWRNPARTLMDRVLPSHGVLPITDIMAVIEHTGYTGPYELEIFSEELWALDYDKLIEDFKKWFVQLEVGGCERGV